MMTDAMIAAGIILEPLVVRIVVASCSRKKAIANSVALCSTAETFLLKKSSALTLAETENNLACS